MLPGAHGSRGAHQVHARVAQVFDGEHLRALLQGLKENGLMSYTHLLTGARASLVCNSMRDTPPTTADSAAWPGETLQSLQLLLLPLQATSGRCHSSR